MAHVMSRTALCYDPMALVTVTYSIMSGSHGTCNVTYYIMLGSCGTSNLMYCIMEDPSQK
jgi:hypothetical protein